MYIWAINFLKENIKGNKPKGENIYISKIAWKTT